MNTGTAAARGLMRGVVLAWALPAVATGTAAPRRTDDQLPTHQSPHPPPRLSSADPHP